MKYLHPHQQSLIVSWSFVLLFVGPGCTQAATSLPGRNETDRLALLAFKSQITDDPFKLFSSWNDSIHFCQWHGITCGRRHQRVVMLDVQSQKLAGYISPYIGNLSFLTVLNLQNNSFSHVIPPELGRLKRLQFLHLKINSINGVIPSSLSGCSNLIDFWVSYNRLEGQLPVEFGSLLKLQFIRVTSNGLSGGIPSSYANLSFLQRFSAGDNNFQGSIPNAFGRLTNLKFITIHENRFSGTIPASVFNLSSIIDFDVAINQIEGSLPSDIGNALPDLEFFSIGRNYFSGSIPVSISNASNLIYLGLPENELTGGVPTLDKLHKLLRFSVGDNHLGSGHSGDLGFLSSLTNATGLVLLDLRFNNFGGTLAETIGNLSTDLRTMVLNYNHISGSIPTGIKNLVNLKRIRLVGNQFTGNVPLDFGKLQKLHHLDFSKNELTGNIPTSLGNLSLLIDLDLSWNNLHGSIPPSLGNCKKLLSLRLAHNNLNGPIPQLFIDLFSLSYLDLSGNYLTGSLPMEVGMLRNLGYLNVSENMLSGEIPSTLGSCVILETLCMEGNLFQGSTPLSLTSLRGIQILDLSRNNLSGDIPEYLEGFIVLQKLNLSSNNFEGEVPVRGIFKNVTAISLEGNSKLCGGIPELRLPSCNSKGSENKRSTTLKLIIPIAFGTLGLILLFCLLFLSRSRKTRKISFSFLGNKFSNVSYQGLLKATDGLSQANLIGEGSFGSVYKGILDQDGTIVAVKVLNLKLQQAFKSFRAECEALRSLKHRNILKLITVCSGVDYHGKDFKALVYEFMVNGSLDQWLHPDENKDEAHGNSRNLNLLQRLNIAIDVAFALDYLHNHCPKPIVHCDLKPSNVLLDNDMTGHVGDFGLARFLSGANDYSSENQTISIGLRGSVGYAAPEYGMGNEVSTSGDVYSYGILLLEMFTGKRPTDNIFSENLNLHNFAKMAFAEQVADIADPLLIPEEREEEEASSRINTQSHKIHECLLSVLRVGIACSEVLPQDRLAIGDVVTHLHVIRNNLL